MASKADWLVKLPDLKPGGRLHIYPADGLTGAQARDAMVAMGYNMRLYQIGMHGTAVIIRRWNDVAGAKPQATQPEFKK